MRKFVFLAAALAALLWSVGCNQDLPSGMTAIFGQVVDPSGAGISGVQVGVVYGVERVSPSAGTEAGTAARADATGGGGVSAVPSPGAGPELGPPYPNPAVDPDPDGNPVAFVVHTETATTARVEVWGLIGGVDSRIRTLVSDSLAAGDRTFTWDGMDAFDQRVPNGLYPVRVTIPAQPMDGVTPVVLERSVLVNRTEAIAVTRAVFNAVTDPDGDYTLDNLPVGEHFTETDKNGTVLGEARVKSRVTVFFQDPDYQGGPETVTVGPGETVEVQTVLQPIYPARPVPERDSGETAR